MKKYLTLSLAFVGMMLVVSCSKDEIESIQEPFGFKNNVVSSQTAGQSAAQNKIEMFREDEN